MITCSKADSTSPVLIKECIDTFFATSGLNINSLKSHVFFGAVTPRMKQELLGKLGFKEGTLPMKYLGVPLIASKLSISDCQPILDKM